MQAAIKRKMERQKRRSIEQGMVAAEGQGMIHVPPQRQRSRQPPPMTMADEAEDSEALEEQLEEMLEGPHRSNGENEVEDEPADLLPIVNSVFGQVRLEPSVCFCFGFDCLSVALCVFYCGSPASSSSSSHVSVL